MPSPAGLLHRPRVCQAIERGLDGKLTIVSAPAGYGKTSALVDFAQNSPVPVCWYTADERDCDLGIFIEYLIGAIRERFPGFGRHTQETLNSQYRILLRDSTGVVGDLTNEMLEIDTPFVVVVDNYEAVEGASGIRSFVRRLLEVLPLNCHLMVGSRLLPDVPVTRLVAKRQLTGLTAQDLRFTPQEIQSLLQLSQVEISERQANTLATNSEGWITGILLLADRLREETQAILCGEDRATAETYNYLIREVLTRQPPDIQDFLCKSAVLREMSPRLCHDVIQIEEPTTLLAEVERRNLFITRFGRGKAATYRYHNLFREFLHEQFRQREPSRCAKLHGRAARWFEQDHRIEEAIYHHLAAGAYAEATVLMERVAMEWFTRGRVETLIQWAQELPQEAKAQAPRLLLYQSKVLTDRYEYEQARQALAQAEAGFAVRGDAAHLAWVHIQHATLQLFEGQYEETITEAQTALDMLNQDEAMEQAEAQRLVGRAYVGLGRLAEGVARLEQALASFRQINSPYDVVNLLQDLTFAFASQGRLDEAAIYLNEALAIARRLGSPTQLAGVLNNLGWLHHARGEYRKALALYEEGLAAARRGDDLRGQANITDGLACVYRDIGAYQRAEAFYNAALEIARPSRPGLVVRILAARADMYRWQGDHSQALVVLEEAQQLTEERGLDFEARGLLRVAQGIALAESGEVEAGLRLLSNAVCFLKRRRADRELAWAQFLLSKALWLAGDELQAAEELRQALDLAAKVGTDQFAVVEGQHTEDLLRFGIAKGVTACSTIFDKVQLLRAFSREHTQKNANKQGKARTRKDSAVGRLEIYAFGEGRVVRDGNTVPSSEWQAAMAKELFFYILLHGPLERDAIGAVFWPELPTKKMRNSFHTTLHRMRHAVGADAVVADEGQYRLGDADYWFDVEEFEALVERARLLPPHDWQAETLWQRAVALYQGDFLPEVERSWCIPRREALREEYLEALIGVARCHEARGELERAIAWYRRTLAMDELREDVHQRIMHCYAEAGRRSEALGQYHRCQEILRRELQVGPSVETEQLYKRIARKTLD